MSDSAQYFLPAPSSGAGSTTTSTRRAKRRRYIDPSTRDYVVVDGGLKDDDGFTSEVVLALATRLGSAQAFPSFGSRLHEIKRADEQGRKLAEKYALKALTYVARKVSDLRVVATLSRERPDAIELQVSGKKADRTLTARYTAVLRS